MNVGRYFGAVVVVWVVRVVCNWLFYGVAMSGQYQALAEQHPGVFREVIPGFIATDLLFTLIFVYLWAKAGASFGGGIKGGAITGAWIGVLFGLVGNFYHFFSTTYMTAGDVTVDAVYQIVSVAIQGAVAAAIYKIPATGASPHMA